MVRIRDEVIPALQLAYQDPRVVCKARWGQMPLTLPALPEDVLVTFLCTNSRLFPSLRPCRENHRLVMDAYCRSARALVLPGGSWHRLLCKRVASRVYGTHPNTMPRAIASLIDPTCSGSKSCDAGDLQRRSAYGNGIYSF